MSAFGDDYFARPWGDVMLDDFANLSGGGQASNSGLTSGFKQELDLLADNSRAGLNALFKQVVATTDAAISSAMAEEAPRKAKNAWKKPAASSKAFPSASDSPGVSSPGRKRDLSEMSSSKPMSAAGGDSARKQVFARRNRNAAASPDMEASSSGAGAAVSPALAAAGTAAGTEIVTPEGTTKSFTGAVIARDSRVKSAVSFASIASHSVSARGVVSSSSASFSVTEIVTEVEIEDDEDGQEVEGMEDVPAAASALDESFLTVPEQGKGKKRRVDGEAKAKGKAGKPAAVASAAAPKEAQAPVQDRKPAGKTAVALPSAAPAPWAGKPKAAAAPVALAPSAAPAAAAAPVKAAPAPAQEAEPASAAPVLAKPFAWGSLRKQGSVEAKPVEASASALMPPPPVPVRAAPAAASVTPASSGSWAGLFGSARASSFGSGSPEPASASAVAAESQDAGSQGEELGQDGDMSVVTGTAREAPEELTEKKLAARAKQIALGYATPEYQAYTAAVPKDQRTATMPTTPDRYLAASKRRFDGMLKAWRRQLHASWNPEGSHPKAEGAPAQAEEAGEQ